MLRLIVIVLVLLLVLGCVSPSITSTITKGK